MKDFFQQQHVALFGKLPWRILVYAGCWMLMMACGANDNPYDASGIFEATEVVVSTETNGAVKRLRLQEGDVLTEGQCVGFVDTVQLYLKQQMLEANLQAIRSRVTDVDKQVAATREQMVKAEKERDRFQSLLEETSWFVRAGQAGPFITPLVWLLALPCLEPEDLWSKLVPCKPFKGLSWCVLRAAVQPEVLRKPPVTDSKHRR